MRVEDIPMSDLKVTVFSQPGWHFCSLEKAWLSEHDIEYVDRDVTSDGDAMNELQELGFFSTPVTVVGDEVVVGFDREKLIRLLNIEGN